MLATASLPLAFLFLLIADAAAVIQSETQWPYNLPSHMKYFPEDEGLVRRNAGIQKRMVAQRPIGVRKMPDDDGEMFFPEYWVFDGEVKDAPCRLPVDKTSQALCVPEDRQERDEQEHWMNATVLRIHQLQAPLTLHSDERIESRLRRLHRLPRDILNQLNKRDFKCPGNTLSCTSINRPNSCCPIGESCQSITDAGLGDVGCCAQGQTCSQQVSSCQEGYKSCPGNSGGGCCIPGYECVDVGCALVYTAIVIVNPTVTASPPISQSTSLQTSTPSAIILLTPVTSSPLSSFTPTSSAAASSTSASIFSITSSSSTSPTTLICSSGYRSCPSSLGGGCCATDRACGPVTCPATSNSQLTTTTNPSFNIPVRPTSESAATTASTSLAGNTCPTGFYQCSAYYHGGCCRVGRDCSLTSCLLTPSTTIVNTNGVTIVAPTGSGVGSSTGSCAQGWSSCAQSDGGGCCPSGYACGQTCTATATGISATTAKQGNVTTGGVSSISSTSRWESGLLVLVGLAIGFYMIS